MVKYILIIMLFLTSCGYESMSNYKEHAIITKVGVSFYSENPPNNMCYYIGTSGSIISGMGETLSKNEFCFYDTCGKFQIGDTIKFIKKQ